VTCWSAGPREPACSSSAAAAAAGWPGCCSAPWHCTASCTRPALCSSSGLSALVERLRTRRRRPRDTVDRAPDLPAAVPDPTLGEGTWVGPMCAPAHGGRSARRPRVSRGGHLRWSCRYADSSWAENCRWSSTEAAFSCDSGGPGPVGCRCASSVSR